MSTKKKLRVSNHQLRAKVKELETALRVIRMLVGQDAINAAARRMLEILREEPSKKKRVYVLIGNEPFEACLQRAQEVIEWGGEPYCQPFLEKTALSRKDYVIRYDWTADKLTHFARYFNRFLWKYTPLSEYRCASKQPFAIV